MPYPSRNQSGHRNGPEQIRLSFPCFGRGGFEIRGGHAQRLARWV